MSQKQPLRFRWTVFNLACLTVALLMSLSSCATRRTSLMFRTDKRLEKSGAAIVHINPPQDSTTQRLHLAQPHDVLRITVTNELTIGSTMESQANNFVEVEVDEKGEIKLPLLDKINVLNMTKFEIKDTLSTIYGSVINSPSVSVQFKGLFVSVLGEVKIPGAYEIPRERSTLLDMLAKAGGITQYGKHNAVKMIRGQGKEVPPEVLVFDLSQLETIESEDMIVQAGDAIYIEPKDLRVFSNAITPYASFLSILSTVGTIAVVVINVSTP